VVLAVALEGCGTMPMARPLGGKSSAYEHLASKPRTMSSLA
jgi:hypothetical protein